MTISELFRGVDVRVVGVCPQPLLWPGSICGLERGQLPLAARGGSSVQKEAQEAFDKQQYEQVVERLANLEKEQGAAAGHVSA